MTTYGALKPWAIHYSDPIRGRAGDTFALSRRDDEYPGWVWATAEDGRAGWVPESWLRVAGDSGVLVRDYTAAELALEPGDVVSGDLVESGWLWARADDGRSGWAPLECLARVRRDGRGPADLPVN